MLLQPTRSSRGRALLSLVTVLACAAAPSAQAYDNPVISNTRDIDCIRIDGVFHLIEPAGGDAAGGYYKYRTSKDLLTWSAPVTLFQRPAGNEVWQGYIFKNAANSFYLYYTNLNSSSGKTIRVASATAVAGPWTDQGALITGQEAIDPYLFKDSNGALYLYYKNDATGQKGIWVQKLSNPTTKTSGYAPKRLVQPQAGTWEDNGYVSAEGPCMRIYAGKYFLLYTGGPYGQFDYAIGYAYSTTPDGTFTKYSGNPIMSNVESPNVYSPGVPTVVQDGSTQDWVVYRQRETADRLSPRFVAIDKLDRSNATNNVINGVATRGTAQSNPVPLP